MFLFKTLWILQNRDIRNLCEFFERRSLDHFHENILSMGLDNGENPWFNFEVFMTYIQPTGNSCTKEQQYIV